MTSALPLIDEHELAIRARREVVWEKLERMLETSSPESLARALRCEDTTSSGPRPFAVGSTVPGFHVVGATRPSALALAGRHQFSEYELTFRLDETSPTMTLLRAETRARFPGVRGKLYRFGLTSGRMHVTATRRMLERVKRAAEG